VTIDIGQTSSHTAYLFDQLARTFHDVRGERTARVLKAATRRRNARAAERVGAHGACRADDSKGPERAVGSAW